MTKGIQIEWPYGGKRRIFEVEYFCGINVGNLRKVPAFETVPAVWPNETPVTTVEYNVDVKHKWAGEQELHLIVRYDPSKNPDLSERYPDYELWGTNTIFLKEGQQRGHCEWLRIDASKPKKITWKAFDLEGKPCAASIQIPRIKEASPLQEHDPRL